MTMKRDRVLVAALALAVAAGACQDTTGPDPVSDDVLLQAAVVAADATLEDITLLSLPFGFGLEASFGQGGQGMGPGMPGGHRGIGGTFSGSREIHFYDADGVEMDAYDALLTERIETTLEIAGEVERSGWSASVARNRHMIISGLAGENTTRVLNGTGSEEISRSRLLDDGTVRSADMSGSFSYDNVVVPTPDQEVKYPLSGTISRDMTVTVVNGPNGDETRSVTVVITFDGSATATGTVNGETFEIDLSARQGRFPLKRGFGKRYGG